MNSSLLRVNTFYICLPNPVIRTLKLLQLYKKSLFMASDMLFLAFMNFASINNLLIGVDFYPALGFIMGFKVFHVFHTEFFITIKDVLAILCLRFFQTSAEKILYVLYSSRCRPKRNNCDLYIRVLCLMLIFKLLVIHGLSLIRCLESCTSVNDCSNIRCTVFTNVWYQSSSLSTYLSF